MSNVHLLKPEQKQLAGHVLTHYSFENYEDIITTFLKYAENHELIEL